MLHLCFRCTWTLEGLNKSEGYFSDLFVEVCINGTVSGFFSSEMLILYPEGAHPESSSCCPQQGSLGPRRR